MTFTTCWETKETKHFTSTEINLLLRRDPFSVSEKYYPKQFDKEDFPKVYEFAREKQANFKALTGYEKVKISVKFRPATHLYEVKVYTSSGNKFIPDIKPWVFEVYEFDATFIGKYVFGQENKDIWYNYPFCFEIEDKSNLGYPKESGFTKFKESIESMREDLLLAVLL